MPSNRRNARYNSPFFDPSNHEERERHRQEQDLERYALSVAARNIERERLFNTDTERSLTSWPRYQSPESAFETERQELYARLREEIERRREQTSIRDTQESYNRLWANIYVASNDGGNLLPVPPMFNYEDDRKPMRILDRKTIKKIKFSLKSHASKMKRTDWQAYYGLLELQENHLFTDESKARLKEYRKRINAHSELHAKIGPEISTFVTINNKGIPVNLDNPNKTGLYFYVLERLRKKLKDQRKQQRHLIHVLKEVVPGVFTQMIGLTHVEKETFSDAIQKHIIENCFNPKYPKPNIFPYIGLELECFIEISRNELAKKLKKYSPYVEIKDDGSIEIDEELLEGTPCDCGDEDCEDYINNTDWNSYELAILVPESEMRTVVPEIIAILKSLDARVNDSCGMHVHLDMRNRNTETVFRNLTLYQDILFQLVDESRRNNSYCRKVDTHYFDEEQEDHYHAISGKHAYSKHRTFEVRIHHGSVNKKEIMAWLELMTRIANYPSFMDKKDNLKLLAETIALDNETYNFYNEKIS